jgi:hypothetical protein
MWKKTLTLAVFGLALGLGACTDPNNPGQRAVGGGLIGGAAAVLASALWRAVARARLSVAWPVRRSVRVQATLRRRSDTVTRAALRT